MTVHCLWHIPKAGHARTSLISRHRCRLRHFCNVHFAARFDQGSTPDRWKLLSEWSLLGPLESLHLIRGLDRILDAFDQLTIRGHFMVRLDEDAADLWVTVFDLFSLLLVFEYLRRGMAELTV